MHTVSVVDSLGCRSGAEVLLTWSSGRRYACICLGSVQKSEPILACEQSKPLRIRIDRKTRLVTAHGRGLVTKKSLQISVAAPHRCSSSLSHLLPVYNALFLFPYLPLSAPPPPSPPSPTTSLLFNILLLLSGPWPTSSAFCVLCSLRHNTHCHCLQCFSLFLFLSRSLSLSLSFSLSLLRSETVNSEPLEIPPAALATMHPGETSPRASVDPPPYRHRCIFQRTRASLCSVQRQLRLCTVSNDGAKQPKISPYLKQKKHTIFQLVYCPLFATTSASHTITARIPLLLVLTASSQPHPLLLFVLALQRTPPPSPPSPPLPTAPTPFPPYPGQNRCLSHFLSNSPPPPHPPTFPQSFTHKIEPAHPPSHTHTPVYPFVACGLFVTQQARVSTLPPLTFGLLGDRTTSTPAA